jgi:hypothetical protein
MRHTWTTRFVIVTAVLLIAACALFAWVQNRTVSRGAAVDVGSHVAERQGNCDPLCMSPKMWHRRPESNRRLSVAPDKAR